MDSLALALTNLISVYALKIVYSITESFFSINIAALLIFCLHASNKCDSHGIVYMTGKFILFSL